MSVRAILTMLTVAAVAACSPPIEDSPTVGVNVPEASPEEIARARSAADALSKDLAGQLLAELERSGPMGAIEVCSQVAQEIAGAYSDEDISVRRVSLRVRNPADEPDAWEADRLAVLERRGAAGDLPHELLSVEKTEFGHELRYLKPLQIAPPCLLCHGDPAAMDADLAARLGELYPQDQAVGYELGDLRGAVSVRLLLEPGDV